MSSTESKVVSTAPARSQWLSFIGSWFFLTMGIIGVFRGTMNVLGLGGFCAEGQPYSIAAHCPAGTRESLVVGLLLGAGSVLLSIFGAKGFGVPAHGYAGAVLFGGEGLAFFIAAFRYADGVSFPLLLAGAVCAALAIPTFFKAPTAQKRRFLGNRRLDGRDRDAHGLPTRDRAVILTVWIAAVVAGIVFATALK